MFCLSQINKLWSHGGIIVALGDDLFAGLNIGKSGEVLMVDSYSPCLMSWKQIPQEKGNRLFMARYAGSVPNVSEIISGDVGTKVADTWVAFTNASGIKH